MEQQKLIRILEGNRVNTKSSNHSTRSSHYMTEEKSSARKHKSCDLLVQSESEARNALYLLAGWWRRRPAAGCGLRAAEERRQGPSILRGAYRRVDNTPATELYSDTANASQTLSLIWDRSCDYFGLFGYFFGYKRTRYVLLRSPAHPTPAKRKLVLPFWSFGHN
jgi:hypothetical protein